MFQPRSLKLSAYVSYTDDFVFLFAFSPFVVEVFVNYQPKHSVYADNPKKWSLQQNFIEYVFVSAAVRAGGKLKTQTQTKGDMSVSLKDSDHGNLRETRC